MYFVYVYIRIDIHINYNNVIYTFIIEQKKDIQLHLSKLNGYYYYILCIHIINIYNLNNY